MPASQHKVIRGGRLLDARAHRADPADVLIEGETIIGVGPPGMDAPGDAEVIRAERRLLHPGLINGHTHGHGNLAKGTGDLWTLELLLVAGGWLNGGRTLEDKYLSTYLGALEMLLKGCTACYDLTAEFPLPTAEGLDACAQAYRDAGMRAVVAPMVAEYSFYQAIPGLLDALPPALQRDVARYQPGAADASLAAMRGWLHGFPNGGLVLPALAPTIPHHCSDAFLCGCRDLSREFGVGLHSHVQESKVQVIAGLQRYGKTGAAHLGDLGLLGPRFTVAHGVWLDGDDMALLAGHGCSVSHNPGSNMRLGNGLADMQGMLRRGVNVGIGTDGANCSDNQNMYENMRLASMVSKVQGPDTGMWVTTEEAFEAATVGSAKALGFDGRLGRIAPGYGADIVFIDLDHVNWMPFNDPTNQLVHTEDGTGVHSVMVAGRMVVQDRAITGVDMTLLAARVEAARERLQAFNEPSKGLCNALSTVVNAFCPGMARTPYRVNRYGAGLASH